MGSIPRARTLESETSTQCPSTIWTSASPAVERAYYSGSSTICYGTQGRSNAAHLEEESDLPKMIISSRFQPACAILKCSYSMSTLCLILLCKTFVQCCSVSTMIMLPPKTRDITPRLSKVADAVIKPQLLVKKYYA